jgi:nucleolar protein TMA23
MNRQTQKNFFVNSQSVFYSHSHHLHQAYPPETVSRYTPRAEKKTMNGATYLMNYGWTEGEALRMGGLKKPILVKHKKDSKGLGHNADQQEAWWERVFDGQLKSLEVGGGSNGISFVQKEIKVSGISKNVSPLYRMFRYGGILEGSLKEVKISVSGSNSNSNSSNSNSSNSSSSSSSDEKNKKKSKKSKKEKKTKENKKKDKSKKSSSSSKSDGKVSKESSKSDKGSSSSKKDKKKDKTKKKSKQESKAEAEWIKQVMAQMVEPVKA